MQESMRLQPVAASPLARVAKRDLHLSDGTVIPAGVMVEAAQYTPMRDERWGWHHGNEFLPVRLLSCLLSVDLDMSASPMCNECWGWHHSSGILAIWLLHACMVAAGLSPAAEKEVASNAAHQYVAHMRF